MLQWPLGCESSLMALGCVQKEKSKRSQVVVAEGKLFDVWHFLLLI